MSEEGRDTEGGAASHHSEESTGSACSDRLLGLRDRDSPGRSPTPGLPLRPGQSALVLAECLQMMFCKDKHPVHTV